LIETTYTSSGTREAKKIGIGWTNFAPVAMETKKGGLLKKIEGGIKKILDSFYQTS
jgi:hypothetical protein